jgi:hypothetical protein
MPDTPLVIPYDIEGLILDTLREHHAEHLAARERAYGEAPGTFQAFTTMVRMSDAQALRLAGDTLPALLLGVIGVTDFTRNENDAIDATFQLGVQVTVLGQRRRDVILRRDLMAFTVAECILQRVPRRDAINSIEWTDYEPLSDGDNQRTVGDARMIFEVGVANAIAIRGMPSGDSEWPLQPTDPAPEAVLSFTLDKEAITE